VQAVAISSDVQTRAEQAKENWKLDTLKVGYGLPLDVARHWGLYPRHAVRLRLGLRSLPSSVNRACT
jgi:hypothetical protein